ncbi:MAG: hypothetical protein WEB52_05375 [Dehalococcoidia bacterium]
MSERRFPIGLLLIAPVALGFAVYAFTGQAQVLDPDATATIEADDTATRSPFWSEMDTAIAAENTADALNPQSTATERPTSTPTATSTPGPQARRGDFGEGAWVRVNAGEGDCLNARNQPSLASEWVIVNACLPHGFEGYVSGEAQNADGHWWWFIAGAGWVAEDYLEYAGDVDIRARTLPELAGRGMIAFLRQDAAYNTSIWVMNTDGSGQRLVRAGRANEHPSDVGWSPDGGSLTFSLPRLDGSDPTAWDIHILPVDGAAETVIENAYGVAWSPDGVTFGTVADARVEGMSGLNGVPAVVNAATGERRVYGTQRSWLQAPLSFNHDGTKLLVTYSDWENGDDPGPRFMVWDLEGNEIARVEAPADTYYASPIWSPVEDRIMFHAGSAQGQPQYAVYDLDRRDIVAGARVPKASDKIGGKCGSWNMWAAAWSRDGGSVLYSFDSGETGANGIWVWDLASGAQSLVPAIATSNASAGPDGYATFSSHGGGSSGYIFIAAPGGGWPLLLTDGTSPVWGP